MSDTKAGTPESTPQDALAQENLPVGKIALVGVASVVLFAIGTVASTYELDWARDEAANTWGVATPPSEVGKPEIGIVNHQLIEQEHRAHEALEEQKKRLETYGWVDKQKKVVHIPIDEAMKQVLAEQKK